MKLQWSKKTGRLCVILSFIAVAAYAQSWLVLPMAGFSLGIILLMNAMPDRDIDGKKESE